MADFEDASVNENGEPLGTTPESQSPQEPAPGLDAPPAQTPAPAAPTPEPALFGWGARPAAEPPVEPAPPIETPPVEPSPGFEVPAVIPEPEFEFVPAPPIPEPELPPIPPVSEPAPAAEQPAAEIVAPAVIAAGSAELDAAGLSDGLTGELRALTDALEPAGAEVPAEAPAVEAPAADDVDAAVPAAAAVAAAAPVEGAAGTLDDIAPGTVAAEGQPATDTPVDEGAAAEAAAEGEQPAAEGAEGAEGTTEAEPATEGEPAAEGAEVAAQGAEATAAAAVADETALEGVEGPRTKVSWWPFIGYIVVWLGAAAYAVWQLQQLPAGQAAYETNFYTMAMLGGLVLLAAGPVLLLIVWLASWIGRENRRIGLMFISALMKGALSTLIGAIIWIGALMLVDYLRLGRPF